jgi:hypothetical protein
VVGRNVPETTSVVQLVAVTQCRPEENDTMDEETFTPSVPTSLTGPDPRQRRRYLLPVAAALLGLALAAAACSSGPSTPGVAGSGSDTPTTAGSTANQGPPALTPAQKAEALAYSRCMRSHGVPDFPDPNSSGQLVIQGGPGSGSGLDPNSSAFKNAENDCKSKQPQPTPAQQAQAKQFALRVARCMRAHGIKDYPDPSGSGRIRISLNNNPGSDLNPNNPLFQRAQAKCMPNAPKLPGGGKQNATSGSGGSGSASSGGGS